MHDAPEVAETLRSFYAAFMQQNRSEMARLLSDEPGLRMIGSNEAWISDRDAVLQQMSDEAAELAPRLIEGSIAAFAHGDVGWASDRPTMVLPDGRQIAFRYSCVMHCDEGQWRIVQSHLSASIPDDQLFGRATT